MKLSLAQSLSELARIVEIVEFSGGDVPDDLIPAFNAAQESVADAVDRRIMLLRQIHSQTEMLTAFIQEAQAKKKSLSRIAEKVKGTTLDHLKLNPGMEFKGQLGEFKLCKTGGACGVDYRVTLQSLSDIVDPSDKEKFPPHYIDKVTVYVLKKDEFERDLRAGKVETPDAAVLRERSEHVRVS